MRAKVGDMMRWEDRSSGDYHYYLVLKVDKVSRRVSKYLTHRLDTDERGIIYGTSQIEHEWERV